jgi:hypothetical protein
VSIRTLKLLLPFLTLGLVGLAVLVFPQKGSEGEKRGEGGGATPGSGPVFIQPITADSGAVSVALDGGKLPVAGGQVPSIVIGQNVLRMVHLCWPHDWTDAGFRTAFKNLRDLYASEEGAALPALRIHLNPIFHDSGGEDLHRAMLQVYFRNETRDSYLALADALCDGSLAPDAASVRGRVEEIDPVLIADWDTRLDWLEADIEKTFSIASVQQSRNAAIVGPADAARLTSMHQTLPPTANRDEIKAFVQQASASQAAWLQSHPTPPP